MEKSRIDELVHGNPLDYQKAHESATPTEKGLLEAAMKAKQDDDRKRHGDDKDKGLVSQVASQLADAAKSKIAADRSGEKPPQATFSRVGNRYNIDGSDFGAEKGKVTLNGDTLETSRWIDRSIKGPLPADAKPGPVVVTAGGETIRLDYK